MKPPSQSENDVEFDCLTFLKAQGWRPDRNPRGVLYTYDGRPMTIGRKGQCDWRAVRVRMMPCPWCSDASKSDVSCFCLGTRVFRMVQYLEFETKRTRGKAGKAQDEYIALLLHHNIPACAVDSLDALKRELRGFGYLRGTE